MQHPGFCTTLYRWLRRELGADRDLVNAGREQHETQHIEQSAQRARIAWVPRDDSAAGGVDAGRHKGRLQRVIDPLAHPDEKNSQAHQQCMGVLHALDFNRERSECPCCAQQHEHLIPVLYLEPGQRFTHLPSSQTADATPASDSPFTVHRSPH